MGKGGRPVWGPVKRKEGGVRVVLSVMGQKICRAGCVETCTGQVAVEYARKISRPANKTLEDWSHVG